jgi:hypothetical protein
MSLQVTRWTVDYGEGQVREVRVPHAWRQEVDVRWEGPAIYKTMVDVPVRACKLRFHGVSYHCEIEVDGQKVATHQGIWDAFDVSLEAFRGKRVEILVRVTKNGGTAYPVTETLAGFLPYVFHTFGGIYRPVEIVDENAPLVHRVGKSRYDIAVQRLLCNRYPLQMRGILHWGWYPETGSPHPTNDMIDREIDYIESLGFNTVKFCLWLPPHYFLEALEKKGLHAWIELPFWKPSAKMFENPAIEKELEAVVRQYAHHPNIAAWTVGCELSNGPVEWRDRWTRKIEAITGCPVVKDNSGGAEMYGGDPREFGSFEDFHPYGELHHFPGLFDSLSLGARSHKPILLGETNDYDFHRDLAQVAEIMPFWASAMSELNDQGVRWQYDIPKFIHTNRFAHEPEQSGHQSLMAASHEKGLFIKKLVTEQLRAKSDFNGYVLTGLRDTPISSSGVLTDWARPRFSPCEFQDWNADEVLFLIPSRDPMWTRGDNRVGYRDLFNFFAENPIHIKVGLATPQGKKGALIWRITKPSGEVIHQGVENQISVADGSHQVAQVYVETLPTGSYAIDVSFGEVHNRWNLHVHSRPLFEDAYLLWPDDRYDGVKFGTEGVGIAVGWRDSVWARTKAGLPTVVLVDGEGGKAAPFWRESITTPSEPWEQALAYCPDQVLDTKWLDKGGKPERLQTRVDTRTYEEAPYIARVGQTILTTYRPHGGHGSQPIYSNGNPAGLTLLSDLIRIAKGS